MPDPALLPPPVDPSGLAAPPMAPEIDPQHLPLPESGVGSLEFWTSEIGGAAELVKKVLPDWRRNLARYKGTQGSAPGFSREETVQVNVDFFKTEQKKAQLFFKTPDVALSPRNPSSADAVPVFNAVLNQQLGPDETDVMAAIDECLMDVLCPSGIAWVKVGYTGSVSPAGGVPIVTDEEYYVERGSPAKLLIPCDFMASNYDKADWLGFKSSRSDDELAGLSDVQPLPTDAGSIDQDLLVDPSTRISKRTGRPVTEVWYRAHRIDPTVSNRLLVRHLVLVDGEPAPRIHEDSPYQRFDPQTGKFLGGVKGFPIKVLTLRYTSDEHLPASDCAMSRAEVDELTQTRTIQMQQKRRALPMRWIDRNRVDPTDITKMARGEVGSILPIDGNGNEVIGIVAVPTLPRDTMVASDLSTRDIDQMWAMGQNQSGTTSEGSKTATELSLIQQNTDVRLDKERSKVLRWYVTICEALGGLLQLFADDTKFVEVAGPDGAKRMQAWNRQMIAGEFVYTCKPDSAQRVDVNTDRKMALDLYQLTANDPNVNRQQLLRSLITKWGMDPAQILQQPPPSQPEKPRISLAFQAKDLADPMVVSLLQQSGYQIDPTVLKTQLAMHSGDPHLLAEATGHPGAPTPVHGATGHGGSAQLQPPLNQHSLDHAVGAGR